MSFSAKENDFRRRRNPAVLVSVVVPCRNEVWHIHAFLDALFRQKLGPIEMEVLIADGMSEDGTRRVFAEFQKKFAALRILDNPEKIASTGLNRAIGEARGEIILRMDVHTKYAPDYIRTCVEVLQETRADNVGGPALTCAEGYIPRAIAHSFHSRFASGGAKFRDPLYEGPARTVPYGCWRKSTLDRVGLFDEDLVRGQDDELNFRIISSGGRVWQSPRIVSWYRPRSTLAGLFRQYFQNGYFKLAATHKHGRPPSWRNLVPGACLFLGAALLVASMGADLAGSPSWRNTLLTTWIVGAVLYFVGSITSAVSVARREGWEFLPVMPVVFATCHLSYALGFLLAAVRATANRARPSHARKVVSATAR